MEEEWDKFPGSPVSFPGMTEFLDVVGIATTGLFLTTCLSAELCLTGSGSGWSGERPSGLMEAVSFR